MKLQSGGGYVKKLLVVLLSLVPAMASAQNPSWTCSLDNIAATLTECQPVPPPELRLYVTDIIAQSTTATGGEFLLRYGTGANCGTGTTSLLPSAASAVRFGYPAHTAAPTVISLKTPLAAPAGKAICAIGIATQTLTIQIIGYMAP